jgi:hypothetical protein
MSGSTRRVLSLQDPCSLILILSLVVSLMILKWNVGNVSRADARAKPQQLAIAPDSCFFMLQLADPQLGMQHGGDPDPTSALDWSAELEMLSLAVRHANRLAPRFVVLSGDQQNWFPNHADSDLRTGNPRNGALARGYGDVGARQAANARRALNALRVPLLSVTAGNHDVGDVPDAQSLDTFAQRWGAGRASFDVDGIRFAMFDSLIIRNASRPGVRERQEAQLAWLAKQFGLADTARSRGIVLLTHVAPFISAPDEREGWANWPLAARERVLRMALTRAGLRPRLIVCGHFHANVRTISSAFGSPVEVVTTSAVGCPVRWNGIASSELSPAEASDIARAETGSRAFLDFVARDHGRGELNFSLVPERVFASPDVSGGRVFEFCPRAGRYRHRWFTLHALGQLARLTDRTLADVAFAPLA